MIKEGVVAVPITKEGKILAVWDGENKGKMEKFGWNIGGERKPIEGLMQFVGGLCETGDELVELVREASEEIELDFWTTDFAPAGVGTLIDHQRANGESMLVGVSIYWLVLSEDAEQRLRDGGAVDMEERVRLRERDSIVYGLLKDRSMGEYACSIDGEVYV